MYEETHAHIIELLPAYALGCLDADEEAAVADHLANCAACHQELAAYQAVVNQLPLAVTELSPHPALKQQLLQQIHKKPQAKMAVSTPARWLSWRLTLPTIFVRPQWQVISALAILILLVTNLLLWQQMRRTAVPGIQITLANTDAAPDATGFIYISADGKYGTLVAENLPQLPPEQQYQLWLTLDGERTSGGVFSVRKDGYASLEIWSPDPLNLYQTFGITMEPAGGSPSPTGSRVLFYTP